MEKLTYDINVVTDISRAIKNVNNSTDKPYRVQLDWKPNEPDVIVFEIYDESEADNDL